MMDTLIDWMVDGRAEWMDRRTELQMAGLMAKCMNGLMYGWIKASMIGWVEV